MDRNPNDSLDRTESGVGTGPTSNQPGTNVLHESAAGREQSGLQSSGAFAGTAGSAETAGGRDRTDWSRQGSTQHGTEVVKDKFGRVREKASQLKSTLADRLESGADRLRQRAQGGSGAYGSASLADTGSSPDSSRQQEAMQRVGGAVADGMSSTANWLRTADVESVKSGIEHQVRSNPARTLVVALGLGYVLGRIFRGGGGGGGGHGRRS